MPYAEIKGPTCECGVLRGLWRGNQQGCPEEGSPQRPHGWGLGAGLWYSLLPMPETAEKYWETRGAKDIESFKDSEFRKATEQEIADEETQGYVMGLRPDTGGSTVFNVVTRPASIAQEAYLREAEESDVDTFLVQTAPYSKEIITPSGNYTLTETDGSKKYAFPGGYERGSLGYGSTKKTLDARYRIVYTVSSNGSTVLSSGGSAYYNLSTSGGSGKTFIGTYGGVNIYGNAISGPVYRAHKKSTVVVQKLVNGSWVTQTDPGSGSVTFNIYAGGAVQGGSVTIDPSTPPALRAKVLVPAALQKEVVSEKKYSPWRYIASQKTEQTKTFLTQNSSTAIQNFAFDGMDDID